MKFPVHLPGARAKRARERAEAWGLRQAPRIIALTEEYNHVVMPQEDREGMTRVVVEAARQLHDAGIRLTFENLITRWHQILESFRGGRS